VFVAARHFCSYGEKGGHAGAGRNGEQPLEEEAAAPVRARSIPAHPAHRAKRIGSVERLDGRVILYMGRLFERGVSARASSYFIASLSSSRVQHKIAHPLHRRV